MNTFNRNCFIQVTDDENPRDFIRTNYFSIIPELKVVSGPGSTSASNTVQTGVPVQVSVVLDSSLPDLTDPANWIIVFSKTVGGFKNPVANETILSISSGSANDSLFTWQSNLLSSVLPLDCYWQLQTTSLQKAGYLEELTVTSEYSIIIQNAPVPPPNPGTDFKLSAVTILGADGNTNYFPPGGTVSFVLTYTGTLPTAQTWVYSTNSGATFEPFVPSVSLTWTVPNDIYCLKTFLVQVTMSGQTVKTGLCSVSCTVTWDHPRTGDKFGVYPADAPAQSVNTSIVTITGSFSEYTNWTMHVLDICTIPCTVLKTLGQQVTLQWSLTQEDVKNTNIGTSLNVPIGFFASLNDKSNPIGRVTRGNVAINSTLPVYKMSVLTCYEYDGTNIPTVPLGIIDVASNSVSSSVTCAPPCQANPSVPAVVTQALIVAKTSSQNMFCINTGKSDATFTLYAWTGQNTFPRVQVFQSYLVDSNIHEYYKLYLANSSTSEFLQYSPIPNSKLTVIIQDDSLINQYSENGVVYLTQSENLLAFDTSSMQN